MTTWTPMELDIIMREAHARGFRFYGDQQDAYDFLATQAGRALLWERYQGGAYDGKVPYEQWEVLGAKLQAVAVEPEHRFLTNHLGYLVYPDYSLCIVSNATDEVWFDVGDFIAQYPEWLRETLEGDERALLDWYQSV